MKTGIAFVGEAAGRVFVTLVMPERTETLDLPAHLAQEVAERLLDSVARARRHADNGSKEGSDAIR